MKSEASRILLHPISIICYITGIGMIFGPMIAWGPRFVGILLYFGLGFLLLPFIYLLYYKNKHSKQKISKPLTLFFSALLVYSFGYNIYIYNGIEGNTRDDIIDNSIITTIVFTGLLASVLPFYNLANREIIITLLSILVLIFSGFLSFLGGLGTGQGISELDGFTAANITAVVTVALILLFQTVNRKKLGSYLLN